MREVTARGWGSTTWTRQMEALIETRGATAIPLEARAELFQDHVNKLASQAQREGNQSLGFTIWWIGSSLTIIHQNRNDNERVEAQMLSIDASLTGDDWQDKQFRLSVNQLRKLESKYFAESCGWLSFWNNLRSRI